MQALLPLTVTEHLMIPLRDGTRLAARLWRPEGSDRAPVPAILEYIPYRKRDFTRMRDEAMHPWFAARGYACLRVDLRGSGESDGILADEYLRQEQEDGAEVIAWIAAQPWCSGAVGMMGKSWGAFNALQVAALRPPALKAVLPVMGTDDRYREDVHYLGGAPLLENMWWGSIMHAFNARPPDPALVGERWRDMWRARLEANRYWTRDWLRHPFWDGYWQNGSVAVDPGAIACPVWFWGGWADSYRDTPFRLAESLKVPHRITMGPWAHLYPHEGAPGPRVDFLAEAMRWWDRWLKGIDTGVMDEPPLQFFLSDGSRPASYAYDRPGRWIGEARLPASHIAPQIFSLAPGRLGGAGEPAELPLGPRQKVIWAGGDWCGFGVEGDLPGDQRQDDGDSLVFTGPPLAAPLDILGRPFVTLRVTADAIVHLSGRLIDVAPDGSEYAVARGVVNLGVRADGAGPEPMRPGAPVAARIELHGVCHRFLPGHRIKLALSNGYWPMIWPAAEKARVTILSDGSSLTLPVRTAPAHDPAPCPPLMEATPETALSGLRTLTPGHVERSVHVDQITGTITHRAFCDGGVFGPIGRVLLTDIGLESRHVTDRTDSLNPDDPLSARYRMDQRYEMARGDWAITIEVTDEVWCDATHFHVASGVVARENGAVFYEATETDRIPRAGAD